MDIDLTATKLKQKKLGTKHLINKQGKSGNSTRCCNRASPVIMVFLLCGCCLGKEQLPVTGIIIKKSIDQALFLKADNPG